MVHPSLVIFLALLAEGLSGNFVEVPAVVSVDSPVVEKKAVAVGLLAARMAAEVDILAVAVVEAQADPTLGWAVAAAQVAAVDLGRLDTLLSLFYTSLMLLSLLLAAPQCFDLTR